MSRTVARGLGQLGRIGRSAERVSKMLQVLVTGDIARQPLGDRG